MSRLFRRRPLAGLAALVGLGLLAAGCSGGGGSAAPGGLEKTNLTVDAVPSVDSAALYIAADRGLFAAEGLHVSILSTQTEAATIASQIQGHWDVTSGPYVSYIRQNAVDAKANFRVLAPGSIIQSNNEEILVPKNSKITTIGGLANVKIAVDGTNTPGGTDTIGTLLVSSVLSDNAITANANQFVAVPFGDMASAMAQGRVAAAWVPEPYLTEAEEKTGAVPLADPNQGSSQDLPISGYMVTASWLKKYPNTAAAFRTAILKAQAIAATNPGAVEQGMEKFAGTQQETAAIASDPEFPTQQNAVLLKRLASLMLNFGMLNQAYNVDQMIVK
jgi:NitT/TauT family transport system substrate-binding protein